MHSIQPSAPKPSLRAFVILFWLLLFGLGMFAIGWSGWSEGGVRICGKLSPCYNAYPYGETAFSFYAFTATTMLVGLSASVLSLWSVWIMCFTSSPERSKFIAALSRPIKERESNRIPTWLFWCVVTIPLLLILYALFTVT